MGKAFKYLAVLVIVAVGLILAWGYAPDIAPEKLAEKYATGASDFLSLPSGDTIHYRLQGNESGKTIVLLHGSNASLHTWEAWVELLEEDFILLTLDLPGHGLTGPGTNGDYGYAAMVAAVKDTLDTLGMERVILGGNSMGGGIAAKFALLHPERLDALVLVDAAGLSSTGSDTDNTPDAAGTKPELPLAFRLAGHWYSDWILKIITPRSIVEEGLLKSFSDPSAITPAMIDRYWELARYPGNREATAKRFAGYRAGREPLPVENIAVPTLILWGADDRLIPVEAAYEFHRRIGGSELLIFDGIGHIPMEEAASESAAAVNAFIKGLRE